MKTLHKKLIQSILLTSGLILLNACGGGGSDTPRTNTTTPETNTSTITHNGTSYGTVTSPHTAKVWLDRNLGAASVCESFNDTACYGDYYQWGRNADGHEDSGSSKTSTKATNITDVGDDDFISINDKNGSDDINRSDWVEKQDASGASRKLNWSKTDGSSVCPKGFRVPTIDELKAETIEASTITGSTKVGNHITAFSNFLKLPIASYRKSNGEMSDVRLWLTVWSSSADSDFLAYYVRFGPKTADVENGTRAVGRSVRCLKK